MHMGVLVSAFQFATISVHKIMRLQFLWNRTKHASSPLYPDCIVLSSLSLITGAQQAGTVCGVQPHRPHHTGLGLRRLYR